jgi:hypothetical protein
MGIEIWVSPELRFPELQLNQIEKREIETEASGFDFSFFL